MSSVVQVLIGYVIGIALVTLIQLRPHPRRRIREPDEAADWQLHYRADDGSVETEHRDGVDWMDAPLPPRLHRCKPQTRGWVQHFTRVYRCACGAISMDGRHWDDRNSRHDDARTTHATHAD